MSTHSLHLLLFLEERSHFATVKGKVLQYLPYTIFTHASNSKELDEKIKWLKYDLLIVQKSILASPTLANILYTSSPILLIEPEKLAENDVLFHFLDQLT